ncbi:MAG: hypothetical protein RL381_648 [Actinomycetota bacterium]
MATVVLDTSVLIALLNPDDIHHEAAIKATAAKNQYAISAISLSESLIAPFRKSRGLGEEHRERITKSMSRIVSLDEKIAVLGAELRAEKKLTLPDALISATAYSLKAQLWSCDRGLVKSHSGAVLV